MNKRILATLALKAILITVVFAQGPATISADQKKQTIDAFNDAMAKNYVFPKLAVDTAKMLNDHLAAHDYDSITDPREFGKTISEQIRALCKDAHLRVVYSAEALPERVRQSEPTAEEIRRFNRAMQFRNGGYEHVDRLPGNVGYIEVTTFEDPDSAKSAVEGAMKVLQKPDALIIDLRRNGGGAPEAVSMLLSYFFDKATHLNDFIDGKDNIVGSNWSTDKVVGEKYLKKPIYVLVSKRTGSAAEECSYDLQCLKRATIIGQSTWGGANPGANFRLNDHFVGFIPRARAQNPYTKLNWEGTGVTPDVKTEPADAMKTAHRIALRELLIRVTDADDKARLEQALKDLEAAK